MVTLKQFIDTLVFNCNLINAGVRTMFESVSDPTPCHPADISDYSRRHYIESKI